MCQGSHLPNFEALGVPNSKRQTRTHTQTDGRTTPHRPIVKDFFETFTKILIFIEDTGLFLMYNIHYETILVFTVNLFLIGLSPRIPRNPGTEFSRKILFF